MNNAELQRIKQRYNIVGNCEALNHILDVALQVAPTDLSVLIIGVLFTITHLAAARNISPSTAVLSLKALSTRSFLVM